MPTLTVVSSKPIPWTHSLQIHCDGSIGPGSHPFEGAQSENCDPTIGSICGEVACVVVSSTVCLGRVKPPSARVPNGRLWWPVYCTIWGELSDGPQLNGPLTSCALTVVSSKPSPWTHSLQIHCDGSIGPGSHPFEGAQSKNRDLTIGAVCGKTAHLMVSTTVCLGRVKPPSARVPVGRL